MPEATKRCPLCWVTKPLEAFAPDPSKAAGVKSWCKACDTEKARAYRLEHLDERRAADRRRYERRKAAG